MKVLNIFARKTTVESIAEQLYETERLYLEYQSAAEMHLNLANVYKLRLERLLSYTPGATSQVIPK